MSVKKSVRTLGFGAKPKTLTVHDVLSGFRKIASISGTKSQDAKVSEMKKMLNRATGMEAKFIIRGLQGKLRIGLAQSTVLVSVAHAFVLTPPEGVKAPEMKGEELEKLPEASRVLLDGKKPLDEKVSGCERAFGCIAASLVAANSLTRDPPRQLEAAVKVVKKAHSECSSAEKICDTLVTTPLPLLHTVCHLTPGVPVEPMLAKPTKSVVEVLKRLDGHRFTCEYKYDGERVQVHLCEDGR